LYGSPVSPLEFELDDGPAIEALLSAYPKPITVSDLYHPSEELDDKVSVAQALYKEGFLLIMDETSLPGSESVNSTDDGNIF
jgi:lysine-specific demethylase/histidyl-hydroxylase NO66